MKEIKLLALDLDGTLTNSYKKVSEKNKRYIKWAQEKGVKVVLASGRPVIGIKGIADILDLWNRGVICEADTDPYVKKEAYNNGIEIIKVDNLEKEITEPVVKFMVVGAPNELNKAYRYLQELFNGKLNIFFSEPYFLEITPLGIEKASALLKLADTLGYTSENIMACGDGLNDIPMLKIAGVSVAMGNAYDETKRYADYISASNDLDGVAVAIDKFILKGVSEISWNGFVD